jgi:hypothetical protein
MREKPLGVSRAPQGLRRYIEEEENHLEER